jgi:hypothetical protein
MNNQQRHPDLPHRVRDMCHSPMCLEPQYRCLLLENSELASRVITIASHPAIPKAKKSLQDSMLDDPTNRELRCTNSQFNKQLGCTSYSCMVYKTQTLIKIMQCKPKKMRKQAVLGSPTIRHQPPCRTASSPTPRLLTHRIRPLCTPAMKSAH